MRAASLTTPVSSPCLRFALPVLLFISVTGLTIAVGYLAMASPAAETIGAALYNIVFAIARISAFLLIGVSFIILFLSVFDCLASQQDTSAKMLWLLIILFAPVLGSLLWFAVGRRFEYPKTTH